MLRLIFTLRKFDMNTPSKDFIIYLAGFFDGEGSITIRERTDRIKSLDIRVGITQSFPRGRLLLKEIEYILGIGSVYHKEVTKRGWHFIVTKVDDCRDLLVLMVPHLKIKRSEAITAIEIIDKWKKSGIIPPKDWRTVDN